MKRRPTTDDKVFFACIVILAIFFGMGLAGALPGQCPSERLLCQGDAK